MSAPTIDPEHRDPAQIAPTNTYRPTDPVWVFRGGLWRSGVVEGDDDRSRLGYDPHPDQGGKVPWHRSVIGSAWWRDGGGALVRGPVVRTAGRAPPSCGP